MTVPELITAATVLVLAAGASLQIWASALAASQAAERQHQQLERIGTQLMRAGARLRWAADQRLAADARWSDCGEAVRWMEAELAAPELMPPPGLLRELATAISPEADVQLMVRDLSTGLERQRRWSPVALGLCTSGRSAPEQP